MRTAELKRDRTDWISNACHEDCENLPSRLHCWRSYLALVNFYTQFSSLKSRSGEWFGGFLSRPELTILSRKRFTVIYRHCPARNLIFGRCNQTWMNIRLFYYLTNVVLTLIWKRWIGLWLERTIRKSFQYQMYPPSSRRLTFVDPLAGVHT